MHFYSKVIKVECMHACICVCVPVFEALLWKDCTVISKPVYKMVLMVSNTPKRGVQKTSFLFCRLQNDTNLIRGRQQGVWLEIHLKTSRPLGVQVAFRLVRIVWNLNKNTITLEQTQRKMHYSWDTCILKPFVGVSAMPDLLALRHFWFQVG